MMRPTPADQELVLLPHLAEAAASWALHVELDRFLACFSSGHSPHGWRKTRSQPARRRWVSLVSGRGRSEAWPIGGNVVRETPRGLASRWG